MENINDILSSVELERQDDRIILVGNIASDYYCEVLKAFFKYTCVMEDTLNGKKKYISDIGSFSYYQLSYGEISKFNGHIQEKADDGKDNAIVVKEEVLGSKKSEKLDYTEDTLSDVYRDLKADTKISLSINADLDSTEKFLNYMGTSLFEGKNQRVNFKSSGKSVGNVVQVKRITEINNLDSEQENASDNIQEDFWGDDLPSKKTSKMKKFLNVILGTKANEDKNK